MTTQFADLVISSFNVWDSRSSDGTTSVLPSRMNSSPAASSGLSVFLPDRVQRRSAGSRRG